MGVRAPAVVRVVVTVAQKLFVLAITLAILLGGSESRKAVAQQPLPALDTSSMSIAPGTLRVRVWPRGDPGGVNAQWFPSANGRESIAVITGGINVLVEGIDGIHTVDISTDRLVVWVGGAQQLNLSGISTVDEKTPLEFYMEGNIEFRQDERTLQASQMVYNVQNNQGVILDAELLAPVPEYEGKIQIGRASCRERV